MNKKGKAVSVWPATVRPKGLHPTRGWGAKSRTGKRNNRTTSRDQRPAGPPAG